MISRATWTAWAWEQHVLPTGKLLLLALVDRVDIDSGFVEAKSIPRIARLTGISERTIQRCLKRMPERVERFEVIGSPGQQIWRLRLLAPWLNRDAKPHELPRWTDIQKRSLLRKGACIHSAEACEECRNVSRLDYRLDTAQSAAVTGSRDN